MYIYCFGFGLAQRFSPLLALSRSKCFFGHSSSLCPQNEKDAQKNKTQTHMYVEIKSLLLYNK